MTKTCVNQSELVNVEAQIDLLHGLFLLDPITKAEKNTSLLGESCPYTIFIKQHSSFFIMGVDNTCKSLYNKHDEFRKHCRPQIKAMPDVISAKSGCLGATQWWRLRFWMHDILYHCGRIFVIFEKIFISDVFIGNKMRLNTALDIRFIKRYARNAFHINLPHQI